IRYSSRGAFRMELACIFCPAIAVPMTEKIPEPITAPMPSEVRLIHPRDFFNRVSWFSESDRSWSILLQRRRCDPTHALRSRPGLAGSLELPDMPFREDCLAKFTLRCCVSQQSVPRTFGSDPRRD